MQAGDIHPDPGPIESIQMTENCVVPFINPSNYIIQLAKNSGYIRDTLKILQILRLNKLEILSETTGDGNCFFHGVFEHMIQNHISP